MSSMTALNLAGTTNVGSGDPVQGSRSRTAVGRGRSSAESAAQPACPELHLR